MNEQTKAEYRKLANHFHKTRVDSRLTTKGIITALINSATEYRPAYWRRLRVALALAARDAGYNQSADEIAATKNPVTSDPARKAEIKKKLRRIKSINKQDEKSLLDYLVGHKETAVFYAISLVNYLGCRPAELKNLRFIGDNKIEIQSAKKRTDRGLDRTITVEDESLYKGLLECHSRLFESKYADPVRYVQKRLDRLTKKLWPTRKARPTLYSWRHQMGSNLKASGKSPIEIAALMGHRSTESVEVYGNKRTANWSQSHLSPNKEAIKQVEHCSSRRKGKFKTHEAFTLNTIANAVYRSETRPGTRP